MNQRIRELKNIGIIEWSGQKSRLVSAEVPQCLAQDWKLFCMTFVSCPKPAQIISQMKFSQGSTMSWRAEALEQLPAPGRVMLAAKGARAVWECKREMEKVRLFH